MTKILSLEERAESYKKAFPKYPPLHVFGRWIYGVWMIGNDYRNKTKFYGAYPRSYLKRVQALFPDIREEDTLHLFSGSLDPKETKYVTYVDIKPQYPEVLKVDAHHLSEHLDKKFSLIFADPPYSESDAMKYGTPMINRNKVIIECYKVLKLNGYIVWLDQVKPMYRKKNLHLFGTVGVDRSTNHRARMVYMFQKITDSEWTRDSKKRKSTKKKKGKTLLEMIDK